MCANVASMRSPKGPVLPDVLLNVFPETNHIYLTDAPLLIMVASTAFVAILGNGKLMDGGMRMAGRLAVKVALSHVVR